MSLADLLGGVYAIVDTTGVDDGRTHADIARAALDGGVRVLQLRAKQLGARELLREAETVRRLTADAGALFILNDRLDLALLVDADGVHLGQEDFPLAVARRVVGHKLLVGISTHDLAQAREAELAEADYIGFGPVHAPFSKESPYPPRGLEALREVATGVALPVIAIGGLTEERFEAVLAMGAAGGAFLSGISAAPSPAAAASALVEIHRRYTTRALP